MAGCKTDLYSSSHQRRLDSRYRSTLPVPVVEQAAVPLRVVAALALRRYCANGVRRLRN